MSNERKKIVAGNWKMNGTVNSLDQIRQLRKLIKNDSSDIIVCPPTTLLSQAINIVKDSEIVIGSQNCHENNSGAHTGEISAQMLSDIGVKVVILGHSERRANNFESSELIKKKAKTSHQANLTTIICIGESDVQKNAGKTIAVITEQLSQSMPGTTNYENTVIAYEPIWAIGSGKIPSIENIKEVHSVLRKHIAVITSNDIASKIRILYGGSVNPTNCAEIINADNVDGALVGGASLIANDFGKIINWSK